MEENLPPGFQLPSFPSWTAPQSVQANSYISAPLAPRTGYEQPYWYRPRYEGWQYVTRGSKVTQQASFHQSSSTYRFTHHLSTGCHATGCHAMECHATGNQFTDYYSEATENAHSLQSGVAYDHRAFPKIVSVHSMGEESYNTLQKPSHICGEEGGNKPNYPFCKSSFVIPTSCNIDAESSKKITDHSISTILDLPSTRNSSSSPVQSDALVGSPAKSDCPKNETKVSLPSDEHDQDTEVRCDMARDGEIKITDSAISCPNFAEGLSSPALQRQKSNSTLGEIKAPEMPHESTLQKSSVCITPLKIKKSTLSLHRLREINKVQKRLKGELRDCQEARFVKKIEMRREKIKIFSSRSLKSNWSPSSESPLNSPPDKRSLEAPYVEKPERNESIADSRSDGRRLELNADITAENSLGETLSSEKLKEEVPEDGFRMNVFEKLALLGEKRCEDSTSSSSSLGDSNSQSADTEVKVKRTHERRNDQIIGTEDELHALRSNSKRSAALENDGELSENINILVKSEQTSFTDIATAGTIPNSWSSAYIYENVGSKSSTDLLKRKHCGEVNIESTKRRCKFLPRKVNWTVADSLDKEPLLSQKKEVEKDEERQDIPLKTEVSCEGENVDAIQFQGIVNRNDNANKPRLSSSPFSQLSIASDAKACWVYDDDLLQRNLELRKSKIGDLLRKQEGLLEKLGSTPLPRK
ncbi:hypothetical protein AWC38_SpisGene1524 [Stylophora pistillata]|uniref:Uncharacterized protein n=1 Tax=Stylophora pistillata TaxID=50429 RepID=A0A2B4SYE3_STYPI|nr:hypothetical protein AWC38_SpisGene1524 [Stylophora pistillata]